MNNKIFILKLEKKNFLLMMQLNILNNISYLRNKFNYIKNYIMKISHFMNLEFKHF